MKRIYLPIIALLAGFVSAFITAGVHSLFFVLLPIMAFAFGYFSSWRRGFLCGFLVFIGYTFATALMWEVRWAFIGFSQYLGAFMFGGFSILLVGALAPIVRKGIRKFGAIAVLIMLVGVVTWCGYISMPHYRYGYWVNILCSEDMEVYLPVSTASDELSAELLNRSSMRTGSNPPDWYGIELVDTEYGQMWKLNMYGRVSTIPGQIGRSSNWNNSSDEILSWPRRSPNNMVQLAPKYDIVAMYKVEPSALSWPQAITQGRVLEEFNVPIKVKTYTEVEFELHLTIDVERISGINFGYNKTEGYIETIDWFKGSTGDQWIMVPAEAKNVVSIRGMGD